MECLLRIFLIAAVAVANSECLSYRYSKVPENSTYAVVGKELRLQWQYSCADPRCPWIHTIVFGVPGRYFARRSIPSGTVHMFQFTGRNKTIDDQYEGRVTLLKNNTMVISQFSQADAVTYISKLLTGDGRGILVSQVSVMVAVPPKFSQTPPPTQIRLQEGGSMSLHCAASGKPAPKITFRKDGVLLSNSSIYHVSMVTADDLGIYTCEAINMAGKISWEAKVVFPESGGSAPAPSMPTITTSQDVGSTGYTKEDDPSPVGAIVGAVLGAVLLVAIVIIVFILIRRKRRSPKDVESKARSNHREAPVHYKNEEIQALVPSDMNKETMETTDSRTPEAHAYETADNKPGLAHTYETADQTADTSPFATAGHQAPKDPPYATAGSNTSQAHVYESADSQSKESLYASADSLHSGNSPPNSHTYAQVDKKIKKKKKRKPGELQYADLDHPDETCQSPVSPQSPTQYADIEIPKGKEPEYCNLPHITTQNSSKENLYATIQNPDNTDNSCV